MNNKMLRLVGYLKNHRGSVFLSLSKKCCLRLNVKITPPNIKVYILNINLEKAVNVTKKIPKHI